MDPLTIISLLFEIAKAGVPIATEIYHAFHIIKTAQSEGRDLTPDELDQLDGHRDQAIANLQAHIAAGGTVPTSPAPSVAVIGS